MKFNDVKEACKLILLANQVPLLVGERGIGKTSVVKLINEELNGCGYVTIDVNLLKEGEVGGQM